ncbi:class Ib ribonucleoside-diphosphate reductase assembly flavoprotein NrdI [Sporolactobacillus shoreicorticis]|uniref:Protein NrdI n=1 Tax=Sporolactobacillus shoreicorticis TaxID=1923877 RepID=A0ABW5SAH5_9BACL|nr:class Ib ribonucleoside-diphosphate reductase assembly flavoprotein NrdI [Sporolactobacillus shoreicorticis]MCO7127292.1 class Ib ribonucleoside-diphosphate reductase assembly flavoprotein NrdI [Sporolactobacillus shoreicorticis]
MRILYATMTGNVKRFLAKTGLAHQPISSADPIDEPYVLVTNTIGFGDAPDQVKDYLKRNGRYLIAVAASGNRNWGSNFAHAADVISDLFHVPVLYKFELGGTEKDVNEFRERVKALAERSDKVKILH